MLVPFGKILAVSVELIKKTIFFTDNGWALQSNVELLDSRVLKLKAINPAIQRVSHYLFRISFYCHSKPRTDASR